MKPKIKILTFGCKANEADSILLTDRISRLPADIVYSEDFADIYVINTCTVTSNADRDARKALYRIIKINPDAKIVFTGCYVDQAVKNDLKNLLADRNIFFKGNSEKHLIPSLVADLIKMETSYKEHVEEKNHFFQSEEDVVRTLRRTRPFLKIQDGCSSFCSFCIVPYVRGKPKSMPFEQAVSVILKYDELGYPEIVISGIHVGNFGRDLVPEKNLLDLLEQIKKEKVRLRIRLSSMEPTEISKEFIDFISENQRLVCPHFHVPLQSGDAEILRRMRRNYSPEDFAKVISLIRSRIPDASIGIDVMTGFPGEKENHFRNTVDFLKTLDFSYLHVFSFSPREGTEAFSMPEQVNIQEKRERSEILIKFGKEKKEEFYRRFTGRKLSAVILSRKKICRGLSENYIPIFLDPCASRYEETVQPVIIEKVEGLKVWGRIHGRYQQT
jgi:threonylcarbamoyladenosine tRNA methylthiotransferase MtaB